MKKRLLLGALLALTAGIFTACKDDKGCNPTLIQPTEFRLNTPEYAKKSVVLKETESLAMSWSQPQYTSDGAPVNATYELQISFKKDFKVSYAEQVADTTGMTVADYIALDKTYTTCTASLQCSDINKALMNLYAWTSAEDVPSDTPLYVRALSFIQEGTKRHHIVTSNMIEIQVKPYYMVLVDADPIMWYLVGNNIGDGAWSNNAGISSMPMFLDSNCQYDKETGAGTVTYQNYFNDEGWKIQPADFNWDMGFMSGGSANTAVFRNGAGDAGNIWCEPAGYYRVEVKTPDNTCTITPLEITPKDYGQICITGTFCGWADVKMTPVNKSGENHVWAHIVDVPDGDVEQIKFKIEGSWDTYWGFGDEDGQVNKYGVGQNGGKNIGVPEGSWVVMFNDITGEFSIIKK